MPAMRKGFPRWACIAVFMTGCTVPVANSLDEAEANRVVVALNRAGVGGDKETDPVTEGRFRVVVERDDAPRAIAALREEDLPTARAPGLLDTLGTGQVIPSQLAEHAELITGRGGELERTLQSMEGVLWARVHLSLPEADSLAEGPRPKPSASVLLKRRGSPPPIDEGAVKRLAAGAAPGLLPADIAV